MPRQVTHPLNRAFLYLFPFLRSAQRRLIPSEMRLRAAADNWRRRWRRPTDSGDGADVPTFSRSLCAWAVNAARRSRVCAISRSRPPSAHPMNSADFRSTSRLVLRGRQRAMVGLLARNEGGCESQPQTTNLDLGPGPWKSHPSEPAPSESGCGVTIVRGVVTGSFVQRKQ